MLGLVSTSRRASRPAATATTSLRRLATYRPYSQTSASFLSDTPPQEAATNDDGDDAGSKFTRPVLKRIAQDFNNRRSHYNQQVSALRKSYASQIERQRAADQAVQEAAQRERTRQRLERQRLKNERSARNALQQESLRQQRAKEFQQHLDRMQFLRDAKDERYQRARQMVIDELEEEAPLWLTTAEEVEKAFGCHDAEQRLWGRPGGVLGAPNPSLDASFWQYETHTWHMDKTYRSQREMLLEELEEQAYDQANVDYEGFWTKERLAEEEALEEKARLRAMVHSAGRSELLRKQQELLEEQYGPKEDASSEELPKVVPPPNLGMLNNQEALEREGAKLLLENPTRFFKFDNSMGKHISSAGDHESAAGLADQATGSDYDAEVDHDGSDEYAGPTLGAPTGLRDPLRDGSHQGSVFPYAVGKFPKADTRSLREKKQQEREERMWAAAQAELRTGDMDIELAAEQQTAEELQPDIDYEEMVDSDDEEWENGVDPVTEKHILETPHERRFKEEDIEWVVEQMEGKVEYLERQFSQDVESLKQQTMSEIRLAREAEGINHDEIVEDEEGSIGLALLALSEKELVALSDLDDAVAEGLAAGSDEYERLAGEIKGLSADQIAAIVGRNAEETL